jgi:hypothetical protein
VGAVFDDGLSSLGPVRAPPAHGSGVVLRPLQVLAGEEVTRLIRVDTVGHTGSRAATESPVMCGPWRY